MGLLPQSYYDVKKFLKHKKEIDMLYQEQLTLNKDKQIQHWNWWPDDAHSMWLHDFIVKRGLLDGSDKTIALCSVFGEREILDRVTADVRIFFSGENLHHMHMCQYADYMLSGKNPFDLAMGFDCFETKRYLRFPLWISWLFPADATEEDIRKRCEELCHPVVGKRDKFCTLIAREDWSGVRTEMYQQLSQIERIDCPSKLFHNDDSLKSNFGDDKLSYLKQYRFNICPENSNAYGYTTEKLFEAVVAGCIPIYWGNDCLDILNPSVVLRWNSKGGNDCLRHLISDISTNEQKYQEFVAQSWLKEGAYTYVVGKYDELESRIRSLL